jgi:RNA polymerase sigma factor (sigma-70 family)
MIEPEHLRAMQRYAQKLVRGSRLEADDIVQDAAINALSKWGSFKGASRLAWLLSITHNTAGMARRASHAIRRDCRQTSAIEDYHMHGDMRHDLHAYEAADALRTGMVALTDRQREIVERLYGLEQTKVEAAASLGIGKVTVWKIARRALSTLKAETL